MRNFILIIPLILCSLGWMSVSVSGFHTVRARPGEEATLFITNISKDESVTFWFRLVNHTKASCIAVMIKSDSAAVICEDYERENFEMRSNISTLYLKIKKVALSDSGLYFCGFYTSGRPIFSVVKLHIEGAKEVTEDMNCEEADGKMIMIPGGLVLIFVIVIGLVVVNCAAVANEETQQHGNLVLKDMSLSLYPLTLKSRRPASERETETHVIYTSSK